MTCVKILFILALICLNTAAYSDEGFMNFGVGVFNSAKRGAGEVKTYSLGLRQDLIDGFYWEERLGLWGQGSNSEGMKSSGYLSTGLGFKVDLNPVEFHASWGLGGITTPDSMLGGTFQFNGNIGITLRDRRGNGIGLGYSHLSSAGLEMPNQGRDFGVLELSQKW